MVPAHEGKGHHEGGYGSERVVARKACLPLGLEICAHGLRDLEKQNARLKRLLADAELEEKAALKEIARGNF